MWTHVDRKKLGQKSDFFVDVINGWPLIVRQEKNAVRASSKSRARMRCLEGTLQVVRVLS